MSYSFVCYTVGHNFVTSSNQYFPCGSSNVTGSIAQTCCYAGDYCMQDGICHYTHSVPNGTGYYMAGCTDPSWQDPACPKQCTSEYGADVIYDTTNNHWDCCQSTNRSLNCQQPSNFQIYAPSPQHLTVVKQLNTPVPSLTLTTGIGSISSMTSAVSGSSAATTASGSSSTSSARVSSAASGTSTANSPSNPSSTSPSSTNTASAATNPGLSGGAKAGIAVGCVFFALLVGLVAFLLWRRSKNKRGRNQYGSGGIEEQKSNGYYPAPTHGNGKMSQFGAHHSIQAPSELPMSPETAAACEKPADNHTAELQKPHELEADSARAELPAYK